MLAVVTWVDSGGWLEQLTAKAGSGCQTWAVVVAGRSRCRGGRGQIQSLTLDTREQRLPREMCRRVFLARLQVGSLGEDSQGSRIEAEVEVQAVLDYAEVGKGLP